MVIGVPAKHPHVGSNPTHLLAGTLYQMSTGLLPRGSGRDSRPAHAPQTEAQPPPKRTREGSTPFGAIAVPDRPGQAKIVGTRVLLPR